MSGRRDEDLLYFALGLAVILALLIAGLSGNLAEDLPMNIIRIGARLAALERQRRGHVPDRQRPRAEAEGRAWSLGSTRPTMSTSSGPSRPRNRCGPAEDHNP